MYARGRDLVYGFVCYNDDFKRLTEAFLGPASRTGTGEMLRRAVKFTNYVTRESGLDDYDNRNRMAVVNALDKAGNPTMCRCFVLADTRCRRHPTRIPPPEYAQRLKQLLELDPDAEPQWYICYGI